MNPQLGKNKVMRAMRPTMKAKRRCPMVATSDHSMGEHSTLWTSKLPGDLLLLIAWRVLAGDFLDYIRFRAVCKPWRDGTVCPRGRGVADPRFHPRRWLMFPEGHGLHPGHNKLRNHLRFLNLDTGTFVRLKLPLFRNHCILDTVDGLLLLHRDEDAAVFLLHPFTGDLANLPPLSKLHTQLQGRCSPQDLQWFFLSPGMFSAVSCDANAGTITVMIMFYHAKLLAFATTQDSRWNLPSWDVPPFQCASLLAFHGKIYMVQYPTSDGSRVFQVDPPSQAGSPPPPPKLVATCPMEKFHSGYHLVECDSEILLAGYTYNSGLHILIYKLEDLMLERFVPVTSIGERALFLLATSLSVSTKAMPTVMAETVVCERPCREHRYVQYHLGTGTWSPAVDERDNRGCDPGPRSLIQHIITCCIRRAWNKGLICSAMEEDKEGYLYWKVKRKFRHWA